MVSEGVITFQSSRRPVSISTRNGIHGPDGCLHLAGPKWRLEPSALPRLLLLLGEKPWERIRWRHRRRTEQGLAERLLDATPSSVILCSVVKAELYFGARNSQRVAENLDRVDRFRNVFDSLPFDDAAAAHYGAVRAQLKREGRPIGANDLMIAAIALSADVTLVSRKLKEFERVPGLDVISW